MDPGDTSEDSHGESIVHRMSRREMEPNNRPYSVGFLRIFKDILK